MSNLKITFQYNLLGTIDILNEDNEIITTVELKHIKTLSVKEIIANLENTKTINNDKGRISK